MSCFITFASWHFGCAGHVHIATNLVTNFCELPNHCLILPRLRELDILERHDELMLLGAGIVPLLLSCLEHTKGRPFQAFCVLSAVVADDTSKQAALALMHGMLHVSKMLKPITVEQEDSGVSPSGEAENLSHASLAIVCKFKFSQLKTTSLMVTLRHLLIVPVS